MARKRRKAQKPMTPFVHDYPDAQGVTGGIAGAGHSIWHHPYPAGGMGTRMTMPGGAAGPSPWPHDYPAAHQPGHPGNLKGTKKTPLTHHLKKRPQGGVHSPGHRP